MTVKKAVVLLDYCSFYITGLSKVRVPLDHDRVGIVASNQCINVSALPWNEGETTITLGPFEELIPQANPLRFDWMLETPHHRVDLFDANMPEILSIAVPGVRTRVRIWTNHKTESDDVVIGVG